MIIDGIIAEDDEADVLRAPQARVRLVAGLLVFVLAVLGLWLSNADPQRWSLRSTSQATDTGSQSPILGSRDTNRAIVSADRRDLPKPNWTDPGHALIISILAPMQPAFGLLDAVRADLPIAASPVFDGFLARAPPAPLA